MPSSYSPSLRVELPATGELINTWGISVDGSLTRLEDGIAGWANITVPAGGYTLTSANGVADQARMANLKLSGAGGPVTVPAVPKSYHVWNNCAGTSSITNGSASVSLVAGETVTVITDGGANFKRIQPTDYAGARITSVGAPTASTDAATKAYADNLAFTANAGILPAQTGNDGKTIVTDGTTARWADPPRIRRRNVFYTGMFT